MPKTDKNKKTANKLKVVANEQCLMIEYNNRKLFTEKKYYKQLIHFGRTFKAKLALVKVAEAELILDLSTLVKILCDSTYTPSVITNSVEVIKPLLNMVSKTVVSESKTEKLKPDDKTIEAAIYTILSSGETLIIQKIYDEFPDTDYTKLYNKFVKVTKEMRDIGWNIEKLSRGVYKATKK